MRSIRATVLLTAGLVTLLGLPAGAAAAETPALLYVGNGDGSHCSDTGSGTQAVPFCTISAAVKVVRPGQTVRIDPLGTFNEAVTIDRSGEPGKPITFTGTPSGLGVLGARLTVSGASHVVLRGLQLRNGLQITRSSEVEVDRSHLQPDGSTGLAVGDGSKGVRVTRSTIDIARIEGGSQGTLLGRNEIHGTGDEAALKVSDAPGTVVTNNTLYGGCAPRIWVRGAVPGSALFNNVLHSYSTGPCPAGQMESLAVSQTSAPGTRADYNLTTHDHTGKVPAYRWAGTSYSTTEAFRTATGQGAHDILTPAGTDVDSWDTSPTIDSGDATAPGVLPTDYYGKPTADDPRVPNTGKDGAYIDRGARETQDLLKGVELKVEPSWAPVGTKVKATAVADNRWPGGLTFHYDFGDGTPPVVTKEFSAEHAYGSPCTWCQVKVTAVASDGVERTATNGVNVTPAVPLTAAFTATPLLPTSTDPLSHVLPLSVLVDTEASATPWPVQRMDVDFGDGQQEHGDSRSNPSHAYSVPGTYTVTVTLQDSTGATSTAAHSVRVDYAPSGYVPGTPFRVLDTRSRNVPVWGGSPVEVPLPAGLTVPGHVLSGSMAVAVLNVTVTDASQDTHLSVWPAGQARPATSNVNVHAGGTASNTVTVPVGARSTVLAQLNAGKASLIVDFVGYYQPNTGQGFTPVAPTRLTDTRRAGGALGAGQTRTVKVAGVNGVPADASAVALNLTSTNTTTPTHVIAYPDPDERPATSNLNPEPGQDKSNQAIVPVGPNGTITLYNNGGSTDLVLDAVGYYAKDGKALFTPVVPTRLADTRSTGKLGPGATTTVAGVPAAALGAVVNVTATETTAPGFLTVYGYGGTLPGASSLNTRPGANVPNHVTTPAFGGRINITNSYGGSNHVVTDLLGYFAPR
ncbi:PKD domain-containing protein [Streptomyces sp. NPDC088762]|uniref:PKD domain-containing protein n=1 Tax=Streptomyces sp. NPDC088762 TaxID=3365891 RepID=UPI003825ECD8